MTHRMDNTQALIEDLRQGKMVVLMDDEDRENEGDLVIAAQHVTAESINFMATHGRGLICLTLTASRCQQLGLPLMVRDNMSPYGTNFTVSIEAAEGVTTGISAADRARTVQAAIAAEAKPMDLRQPGHIFPIMAQAGGVLSRAGHTEAGCDLAALAGLEPAAVIVEIMNEDGTMARRPQLEVFAKKHGLKIGTIADLIHYRSINEKTVERVSERPFKSRYGDFRLVVYRGLIQQRLHYALVKGDICPEKPTKVRVHISDPLFDMMGDLQPGRWPLDRALACIGEAESGVVVILARQQSEDLLLKRLAAETQPVPVEEDIRVIGCGSQILADLGVGKMQVLSAEKKYHALSGFNLSVDAYLPYVN